MSIAGAGGAAHLPGMIASKTIIPVLGVPVKSKNLNGIDSLLSIVQMPPGVPVGTLAIGNAGAQNAALLAASIIATSDDEIAKNLKNLEKKTKLNLLKNTPLMSNTLLPLGSSIGILGGGQLGRMIAMSCIELGYKSFVYCPKGDNPAVEVSSQHIIGDWNNDLLLNKFISSVDAVTIEFENIPIEVIQKVEKQLLVYPNSKVLSTSQYRPHEKKYAKLSGIDVPRWWLINSKNDLEFAMNELDGEGILKTTSLGYDGKGQNKKISKRDTPDKIWETIKGKEFILEEEFVNFNSEISFLICRRKNKEFCIFPPTENKHKDGILNKSKAPADLSEETWLSGAAKVSKLAEDLELNGLLAVEFFY